MSVFVVSFGWIKRVMKMETEHVEISDVPLSQGVDFISDTVVSHFSLHPPCLDNSSSERLNSHSASIRSLFVCWSCMCSICYKIENVEHWGRANQSH